MKHAGDRVEQAGGKDLHIPEGNAVLLRDHPEGRNKIQDGYKSEMFKVVKQLANPDNVIINPENGIVGSQDILRNVKWKVYGCKSQDCRLL